VVKPRRRTETGPLPVHLSDFSRALLRGRTSENPSKEYLQFFCLGIDGLFSDFPDTAVSARDLCILRRGPCVRENHQRSQSW
jgi:hypothetical protein